MRMRIRRSSNLHVISTIFYLVLFSSISIISANAYQASVSDRDALRQTCSGMWADKNKDTRVEFTILKGSSGTISLAFYSWKDFHLLGRETPNSVDQLGFPLKTYVCTSSAVSQGICSVEEEGQFITSASASASGDGEVKGTSIQKQRLDLGKGIQEDKILTWKVEEKGYYCLATIPLTTFDDPQAGKEADSGKKNVEFDQVTQDDSPSDSRKAIHAKFDARIHFYNVFKGNLPASEYPKLNFYFGLACVYSLMAIVWFLLCMKHRAELLTVQHFLSFALLFLIVEMFSQFGYLTYTNSHSIDFTSIKSVEGDRSVTATARTLLGLSSALDAGRNSMSLFLLLIVSMGYGVIRPSLSRSTLRKVQALTLVHFVFGLLYSIGTVLIIIESGGAWIFMFIMPLSVTLSSFMMWILSSLNSSIEHLTARKQTFKKRMFVSLHRILIGSCVFILLFFIGTSFVFSQSGGEDFAPNSWEYRWFLLDGWVGLLYLFVFSSIAYIWRPTGSNLRMSMSDEIALDEDPEAGQFEIDTFAAPGAPDSDDEEEDEAAKRRKLHSSTTNANANANAATTSSGSATAAAPAGGNQDIVFEIGDEDDDEGGHKDHLESQSQSQPPRPPPDYEQSRERERERERKGGNESERKGLMDLGDDDEDEDEEDGVGVGAANQRQLDKGGKKD